MKRSSKHIQRLSKMQHKGRKAFGDECSVCFHEDKDLVYVCECKHPSHAVCGDCMRKLQQHNNPRCPTCRKPCLKSYKIELHLHKDEQIEINKIHFIFQAYETCYFDFQEEPTDFLFKVLTVLQEEMEEDPKVKFIENCAMQHTMDDFTSQRKQMWHEKLDPQMRGMVQSDRNMVLLEVYCNNMPRGIAVEQDGVPHMHSLAKIIANVAMQSNKIIDDSGTQYYWLLRPEQPGDPCGLSFGVMFIDGAREKSNISIFKQRATRATRRRTE